MHLPLRGFAVTVIPYTNTWTRGGGWAAKSPGEKTSTLSYSPPFFKTVIKRQT